MKHISGINRVLPVILLIAALILPSGMKQVMANSGIKQHDRAIVRDDDITNTEDEDYSISVIKFFNWI